MLLDGSRLIVKALSCGVKLKAVYCSRPHNIDTELSTNITNSETKLYQLTPQQMRLCREKGITSPVFGKVLLYFVCHECFGAVGWAARRASDL